MGFMDKAKKMAEQAQAKLDEAQGKFNSGQAGQQHDGPAVEYDKHGRPIQPAPVTPDAAAPVATPGVPPTEPAEPQAGPTPDPAAPTTPATPPAEDRNRPSDAPPKLSSGDPLAG
jgi:hypothetical protein